MCHTSLLPTEPIYDQCPTLTFSFGLYCISFACFMFETELSNIKSASRIHSKARYNTFLVSLVELSSSEEGKESIKKTHFKSHYKHIKCLCCAVLKAYGTTNVQLSYNHGYVNWHYGKALSFPDWEALFCLLSVTLTKPAVSATQASVDLRNMGFRRTSCQLEVNFLISGIFPLSLTFYCTDHLSARTKSAEREARAASLVWEIK